MESVMINLYICLSLNGYFTVMVKDKVTTKNGNSGYPNLNRQVNHPSHYMGYHFANRNNLHVINGLGLSNSSEIHKSNIG